MIKGRCPICSKSFEIARLDDLPSFPFCSDRCRLIDLGRWIDGAYVIPGSPATASDTPRAGVPDEEESSD
ncbi:MAG: DNA gyrase inhibitor YacG [Isosphaeraceae bacterium]